jgi:small GTP-binding protein
VSAISGDSEARIVIVGKFESGKTSMIHSLLKIPYSESHEPTIGCNLYETDIVEECTLSNFHVYIWDTSGNDAYDAVTRKYYKGTTCAVITCDAEDYRMRLQETATRFLQPLRDECGPIPVIIAVTRSDRLDATLNATSLRSLSIEGREIPVLQTSIRDRSCVTQLFKRLLLEVVRHHQLVGTRTDNPIHRLVDLTRTP